MGGGGSGGALEVEGGVGLWQLVCGTVMAGGVLWWGEVYADGECVWGWCGGCGERVCGRGGLGSGRGDVGWGGWVGVLWCGEVDGGRCMCGIR